MSRRENCGILLHFFTTWYGHHPEWTGALHPLRPAPPRPALLRVIKESVCVVAVGREGQRRGRRRCGWRLSNPAGNGIGHEVGHIVCRPEEEPGWVRVGGEGREGVKIGVGRGIRFRGGRSGPQRGDVTAGSRKAWRYAEKLDYHSARHTALAGPGVLGRGCCPGGRGGGASLVPPGVQPVLINFQDRRPPVVLFVWNRSPSTIKNYPL